MTSRLKLGAQALAVALVVGLLALLIWKVAQGSQKEAAPGKPAPDFTLSRIGEPGRAAAVLPAREGRSCSTSGPPGATRAGRRHRRSRRREALGQALVVLGVDVNDFAGRRARLHAQVRAHLPGRARQQEQDDADVRPDRPAGDVLHRPPRPDRRARARRGQRRRTSATAWRRRYAHEAARARPGGCCCWPRRLRRANATRRRASWRAS